MAKKIVKLNFGNVIKTINNKKLRKLSALLNLVAPRIEITDNILNIYDDEGIATSYDILVDGVVIDTVEVSQEPSLPVWDRTDLTGTTWHIPAGWAAQSGYGEFDVSGNFTYQNGKTFTIPAEGFWIGYSFTDTGNGAPTAESYANTICIHWNNDIPNTESFTISIIGGPDATNTSLISWFKANGELTSHTMPEVTLISFTLDGKEYQAEEGMTWEEWVASEYNTGKYKADGSHVSDEYSNPIENSADVWQQPTDHIIANESYNATSGTHSGGMN